MIIGASTSRAARGLLNWTQAELAETGQVALSTVNNFEAGRSLPSGENLFAIQRALEAAGVEFLPRGGVRLRPDPITFELEYRVDRYKLRMTAKRQGREVVVDVPRETIDDAARLIGASTAERRKSFEELRTELEACAEDLLRSQAPEVDRVSIDYWTFEEWRRRRGKLLNESL